MNAPKHAGGRPRKGSLEFRGRTWHARLTVTVDGVNVRRWFNPETDNKAVARRKLARLMAEQAATSGPSVAGLAVQARRKETVADVAAAYGERRQADGVKTWKDEDRRLRLDVLPVIGSMAVHAVRPAHVREVLEGSRAKGAGAAVADPRARRDAPPVPVALALRAHPREPRGSVRGSQGAGGQASARDPDRSRIRPIRQLRPRSTLSCG